MRIRLESFSARVLRLWDRFVIWGAGRDGKDVYKAMSENVRNKVIAFVDVDEKKIKAKYYVNKDLKCKVPVYHFKELKNGGKLDGEKVMVCVAMYRTGGVLEDNVRSIGREEGVDLWHFV
jgi:FlaA1/EpsC-like NDP-sugar epimerase